MPLDAETIVEPRRAKLDGDNHHCNRRCLGRMIRKSHVI